MTLSRVIPKLEHQYIFVANSFIIFFKLSQLQQMHVIKWTKGLS